MSLKLIFFYKLNIVDGPPHLGPWKIYPLCFSERAGPGDLQKESVHKKVDNFTSYCPLERGFPLQTFFGGKMEGINNDHF